MNKYVVTVEVLVEADTTLDAMVEADRRQIGAVGIDYTIVDVERQRR